MRFHDKKAIYLQIADYFLEKILKGNLHENERVLSVREMASEVEVNPNTVMRTYSFLQDLDILYNKRGIGYFIAEDAREKAKSIKKEEFMKEELPLLFKTMDLLEIKPSDLNDLYAQTKKTNE
jgi:DNA-binding transcriptional regulator YhcF (GntR family)